MGAMGWLGSSWWGDGILMCAFVVFIVVSHHSHWERLAWPEFFCLHLTSRRAAVVLHLGGNDERTRIQNAALCLVRSFRYPLPVYGACGR